MGTVACFCGCVFYAPDLVGECPYCGIEIADAALPLTEREIRALLRAATAAKIITGWNGIGEFGKCEAFFWYGPDDKPGIRSLGDTIARCLKLRADGIQPLYRDSEPNLDQGK